MGAQSGIMTELVHFINSKCANLNAVMCNIYLICLFYFFVILFCYSLSNWNGWIYRVIN
jgi:hypothetical protein